jgi:hypothetical protein
MHVLPILFADDDDIWVFVRLAFIALIVIGPVILKALGGSARQADRTPPPKRKKPQPSGAQMPSDRSSTDAEIEDFLRRAEAKRRGGPAGQALPVQPRPQPQRQPVANPYLVSGDEAEIVEAQVVAQPVALGDEMESRFESSISTSDFEQRAQRLGDRVEHADDAMESRLHAVFDHGLGDLSQVSATVATADVTPAPEDAASTVGKSQVAAASVAHRIAARMRSASGMRDAIVLREILEPPEHRW